MPKERGRVFIRMYKTKGRVLLSSWLAPSPSVCKLIRPAESPGSLVVSTTKNIPRLAFMQEIKTEHLDFKLAGKRYQGFCIIQWKPQECIVASWSRRTIKPCRSVSGRISLCRLSIQRGTQGLSAINESHLSHHCLIC